MRKFITTITLAAAGAGLVVAATPAQAATSHIALARADWIEGSKAVAAVEGKYWAKARGELRHYGARYAAERRDLTTLISIPLTDTIPAQRATATRITRELNAFFHTPGLYGVAPAASHLTLARRQWVAANQAPAANMDHHLRLAARQLAAYGKKYAIQRGQVTRLAALPITGLTKAQLAQAYRLVHALNVFFHTHY
ncbi:hypothetical protein [Jatrophihabitans fulvus]